MGSIMQACTGGAKRTEWLLDRIRRGQFADLDTLSADNLESLKRETARAYESLPESRETDRGRVMLLQGRVNLELRKREHVKPAGRRRTANKDCSKLIEKGLALSKGISIPDNLKREYANWIRAEKVRIFSEYKRVSSSSGTGRGRI